MQDNEILESEGLRKTLAKNLVKYRKANKLTQMELAQKLSYSDKNISRWERGELIPDVINLKKIADLYGLKVDDLISENKEIVEIKEKVDVKHRFFSKKQLLITLLSISIVWLVAFISFFVLSLLPSPYKEFAWKVFIIAIPISTIVCLVFTSLWCTNLFNSLIVTILIWSIALTIYVTFSFENSWLIFILAIPVQIMDILWFTLRKVRFVVNREINKEKIEKESGGNV